MDGPGVPQSNTAFLKQTGEFKQDAAGYGEKPRPGIY